MDNKSFNCERCDTCFATKAHLLSHLNRKKTCEPLKLDINIKDLIEKLSKKLNEKTFDCSKCGKPFNYAGSRYNHEKICKVIKDEPSHNTTNTTSSTVNVGGDNNGSINNNNSINITIAPQIKLNPFGKEDISYIVNNPEFIAKCIKNYKDGIPDLIETRHFDPDHPENHNIKKDNKKDNFISTFDGKKWNVKYSDDVLDIIYTRIGNVICDFIDEIMSDDLPDKKKFPNIISERQIENMMKNIGEALDWSIETDKYTYENSSSLTDKMKEKQKDRLNKLICQRVYSNTITPTTL